MDFEALGKKADSIFDVTSGPNCDDTVQTEGWFDLNAADARVRMHAARESSMKHVR
jgi:hypothetical protein